MMFNPEGDNVSFNLARLKKSNYNFEVVIDPELAFKFRRGEINDVSDVLKSEHIFFDAKKGLLASEHVLEEIFGTSDPLKIAEIIIKEGDLHLTTKQREALRKQRLKRIIEIIHTNAIDPRTGLPIPPQRIEAAINEAKVHVDLNKNIDSLLNEVVKKIKLILPLRFEKKMLHVKVPSKYAGRTYGALKDMGELTKEEWLNDGSFSCDLSIPAGLIGEVVEKINDLTHGSADIKIIKR